MDSSANSSFYRPTANLDPPGSPLIRGDRNYFPDGLKFKRIPLSASFRGTLTPSLEDASPRSSAPLHLRWPPTTAHPGMRCRDQHACDFVEHDKRESRIIRNATIPATADKSNAHFKPPVSASPLHSQSRNVLRYLCSSKDIYSSVARVNSDEEEIVAPYEESLEANFDWPGIFSSSFASDSRSDISVPSSDSSSRIHVSTPATATSLSISPRSLSPNFESAASNQEILRSESDGDRMGFQVHVRIKPLEDQDFAGGSPSNRLRSIAVKGARSVVLNTRPSAKKENNGSKYAFHFDHVLNELSTQKDAYDVTIHPLVELVLKGHHACVITYGSPGTGKSYALYGQASSGKHKGIITRAAEVLLSEVEKENEHQLQLSMSFIHLYNEKFYDILDPSATDNIRFHDFTDSSKLEGVTELPVKVVDDVNKQLRRNPNRLRDAGRSHTVFTLHLRREEDLPHGEKGESRIQRTEGKIDFVDLVGVCRSTKHSTHDSMGNNANAKANRSLQVFSKVITSLSHSSQDSSASYRDSKLTRFLKEALGGNCATRLLVTASSCPNSTHETLVCLQFATTALSVSNHSLPRVSVIVVKEEPQESKDITEYENNLATEAAEGLPTKTENNVLSSPVSEDGLLSLPPIPRKSSKISSEDGEERSQPRPEENKNMPTEHSATRSLDSASHSQSENERTRRENVGKSSKQVGETKADGGLAEKSKKSRKNRRKSKSSETASGVSLSPRHNGRHREREKSPDSRWSTDINNCTEAGGNVVTLPSIDGASGSRKTPPSRSDDCTRFEETRQRKRRESSGKNNLEVADFKPSCKDSFSERKAEGLKTHSVSPALSAGRHSNCDTGNKEVLGKLANPFEFDECLEKQSNKNSLKTAPGRSKEVSVVQRSGTPTVAEYASLDAGDSEREGTSCKSCREREERIKKNYDRLIMFSKADKEQKQKRIQELEQLLASEREQSETWAEIQRLREENKTKQVALEKAQLQVSKLEEVVEDYKKKVSHMVSAKELSNVQEMRRKENAMMEEQRQKLVTLTKNLDDQTKGASKMLEKKSEQYQSLEKEKQKLQQEKRELEKEVKNAYSKLQTTVNKNKQEQDKLVAKYEEAAREMSSKLSKALSEISCLKEERSKSEAGHRVKKESMQRELNTITMKLSASQQDVDKMASISNKENHRSSNTLSLVHVGTNTEDFTQEKLNGLAYNVQCLRCAAKVAMDNGDIADSTDVRDAELRILLFQDSKNREVLIQLKRERNLLRDVMKIMYCRQWFTEDGKPHVKRTLKRVGIDTRELEILKKTTHV